MSDARSACRDDLCGRVAIITGGGAGLGARAAHALAAAGCKLILTGRTSETLDATCAQINAAGGVARYVSGSVSDPEHVDTVFASLDAEEGRLDILVNNAGIAGPSVLVEDMDLAAWQETLAVNLTGVMLFCRRAVPRMRQAGWGRIVNIGSGTGKRPLISRTAYATSKLGLVGLTRTLAHEVGPDGITANVVSPFMVYGDRLDRVVTDMARSRGVAERDIVAELARDTALGHGVSEDDVVATIEFLCSAAAGTMTGQDLNVSAGAVMV
jgi:NAD(P)-dependent dehydrogenase (short-subunit alcohol dehydrogenase family)